MGWGGVPTGAGVVDGGCRPRALVAGEGWGARRGDGSSKEGGGLGLGWLFQRGVGGRGRCKGFGCGGVGGRGTGLRDGANFATGVVFLSELAGGRARALIPGEGVREGLAWRGKAGWVPIGGRGVREVGQGLGRGARASVPGE